MVYTLFMVTSICDIWLLQVCDELEDMMEEGGNIVDYHGCDFFPERWFDRVVVLQTENSVLYDRLTKRGYTGSKLTNNIECEIFQVLLEEAKDSYPEDIVVPLKSDNVDDINRNIATLTDWKFCSGGQTESLLAIAVVSDLLSSVVLFSASHSRNSIFTGASLKTYLLQRLCQPLGSPLSSAFHRGKLGSSSPSCELSLILNSSN
ncbi:hypothetical protein TEA_021810 [Camellia sinensis var. sinensis]|uniref:Uncharacterized protein n=1 Tax=Camellia sinensis var. sinensis TaxID=542762 RepID=A0A4S4D905_CAMSN|nr:hypothetical protein TEA_021810 [Camellia sinensis var. sinensis]